MVQLADSSVTASLCPGDVYVKRLLDANYAAVLDPQMPDSAFFHLEQQKILSGDRALKSLGYQFS
jgi:hypothetical protein